MLSQNLCFSEFEGSGTEVMWGQPVGFARKWSAKNDVFILLAGVIYFSNWTRSSKNAS